MNSTELSAEFQSAVVWAQHVCGAISFVVSSLVCWLIVFDGDSRAKSYRKYLFSLQFSSISADLFLGTYSPLVQLNCRVMYSDSVLSNFIPVVAALIIYVAIFLEVVFSYFTCVYYRRTKLLPSNIRFNFEGWRQAALLAVIQGYLIIIDLAVFYILSGLQAAVEHKPTAFVLNNSEMNYAVLIFAITSVLSCAVIILAMIIRLILTILACSPAYRKTIRIFIGRVTERIRSQAIIETVKRVHPLMPHTIKVSMLLGAMLLALLVLSRAESLSDDATFMNANKRLYDDIFKHYRPHHSPYNTGSTGRRDGPAKVFISLRYSHLTQVIEVQMSHHHVFGIELVWRDPRLTWDPAIYNNVSYIYVRSRDIWMPEITACESSSFKLITSERRQKARLNSTGHVEMYLIGHASFICEFSVEHFPFDHHWCNYCFALPNYEENELILVGTNASSQTVLDSSEWKMRLHGTHYWVDPETRRENPTFIYFDLLLSRRSSFWIYLMILPSFLLGFLILLGLFFGKEKNNLNKSVDLGLIAFTSFTFIIGILADSLPQSEYISILGWHIVFELLIITAAILSVSLHGYLCSMASSSYTWWTGDNQISPLLSEAYEMEQKGKCELPRSPMLFLCVEKIRRGVLNFSIFLALHILNLGWLLAYAFEQPPEQPDFARI